MTTAAPRPQECRFDCDFEQDFCHWSQLLTDVFDWKRQSVSTQAHNNVPSSDHTPGGSQYLHVEANKATYGDTARLLSPECFDSGPQCLQFWYYMYGSADTMGIHVYLLQARKTDAIWWKTNGQGNMWHSAQVELVTAGAFQIIFEGRTGSNDSYVAIDDISLHHGLCKDMVKQTACAPTTLSPIVTSSPHLTTEVKPTVWQNNSTSDPQGLTTTKSASVNETLPQPPTTTGQPASMNESLPQPPTSTGQPASTNESLSQPPTTTGQPASTNESLPQPPTTTGQPASVNESLPQPPTTMHQPASANGTLPQAPTTTGQPASTTESLPQPPTTTGQPASMNESLPQAPTTTGQPASTTESLPQPPITVQLVSANETLQQITEQFHTTTKPESQTQPLRPAKNATRRPTISQPVTLVPTPSCTKNSHYTTCMPACSPTCSHLDGPPRCTVKSCTAGCVCDNGFVKKGGVCVPLQECGCLDNGIVHHFNDMWYINHCAKKCECDKADGKGKVDCDDEGCDDEDVCIPNMMGQYYCTSTGFSECKLEGDSKYKTFDDMKHITEGKHLHVLVQTKNLPINLPEIYIEGSNACNNGKSNEEEGNEEEGSSDSEDSESNEDVPKRLELKIKVYNITVELKPKHKVFVNEQEAETPVSPVPGLNIYERHSYIYLKTDFGLTVEFSGHCKAVIILPNLYKRSVEGLCGNFDGRKSNDKIKSNGRMAQNTKEFGDSWRV